MKKSNKNITISIGELIKDKDNLKAFRTIEDEIRRDERRRIKKRLMNKCINLMKEKGVNDPVYFYELEDIILEVCDVPKEKT